MTIDDYNHDRNVTYDYAVNIISTTDAKGGRIHYCYNSQGRVCEITDQEGLKERFYYDREGRQILSIDRLGNRVETRYNIDGNPVRRISSDKDGKNREVRVWEYDCLGYLKEAVGGGFRYRYEYRPDGKLLCKETSGGFVVRYTYYPDGSVKTMADGSGRVLSYGYDRGGRLVSIVDGSGEIVGYCHTPGGKVKEIRHRNGVRTAYEYDTEGNIIRLLTETRDGEAICDLQYEYDAFGALLERYENVPNRLLYGGQQYDRETEQYYLRTRYYNPVIGRFMQEDVYRGDGLNLYAYCANNPVMYYDPSGRNGVPCEHGENAEENVQKENVTGQKECRVDTFEPPEIYKNEDGVLTNGKYTIDIKGMNRHRLNPSNNEKS